MASVDHLMCKSSVLQQKHMDGRYVDQASINQIGDLTHRIPSSLKIDNHSGLAEASPPGFLSIAFDITVCSRCEDADHPASWAEQVQCLRQSGGPYCIQDDLNALSRPFTDGSAYVFGLVVNYTVCAETSDVFHIRGTASRCDQ
jgi:hypothetical protein